MKGVKTIQGLMAGFHMNNEELEKIYMEAVGAQTKYHPSIYPEGLKKIMKNFSQQVRQLRTEFSTSQIYKYKPTALPLDQHVQFLSVNRDLNFFLVVYYVTCNLSKPGDLITV
ncbi:uncharacterized protein LOC117282207 [Cryptotermes secundus]|uniref:uncharacterized protein LOC117282207 n=1 Tax=Cryptotermes secundus TaxID=105785 RepID=UPI001454DF41|nr:uncharacterized protein LOC117282207 [Cryptotermes secundus]